MVLKIKAVNTYSRSSSVHGGYHPSEGIAVCRLLYFVKYKSDTQLLIEEL